MGKEYEGLCSALDFKRGEKRYRAESNNLQVSVSGVLFISTTLTAQPQHAPPHPESPHFGATQRQEWEGELICSHLHPVIFVASFTRAFPPHQCHMGTLPLFLSTFFTTVHYYFKPLFVPCCCHVAQFAFLFCDSHSAVRGQKPGRSTLSPGWSAYIGDLHHLPDEVWQSFPE